MKYNPSYEDMRQEMSKWWDQRHEALTTAAGWSGRNLLDNTQVADTIVGIESDITFLLRLNMSLLDNLITSAKGLNEAVQSSGESITSKKASTPQSGL